MYSTSEVYGNLYEYLSTLDQFIAERTKQKGCPECGGPLHQANYPRKPRGSPPDLPDSYYIRLSFCCGREGCRKRVTPPSVRFLGRRVYLSIIVVVRSAVQSGLEQRHVEQLRNHIGGEAKIGGSICRQTLGRWRSWWREQLPTSRFWQSAKACLVPPVDEGKLPESLLGRFIMTHKVIDAWVEVLRCLEPVSIGPLLVTLNQGVV